MPKIPLMIDTDTAGDDCLALLVGLLDPSADLLGVTVTAGNLAFDRQLSNALLTINAAGRLGEVPVHAGAREPLDRAGVRAEEVHGDGVGGLRAELGDAGVSEVDAVEALLSASREHEGSLVVVCIAPLTTIATAIRRDPGFATRVKRFFVMGGSNNGRGNITASAEYNFYVDPEAADEVFRSGASITVIPWAPVTLTDAVFDRKQRAAIEKLGTPLAEFFGRVTRDTLAFEEAVGIAGSTHPDSLTTAVALHPRLVERKAEYNVQVEKHSELTRGHSAMSWGIHGLDPNAVVVESVHSEHFYRLIQRILKTPAEPSVVFDAPGISRRRPTTAAKRAGAPKRAVAPKATAATRAPVVKKAVAPSSAASPKKPTPRTPKKPGS